MGQCCTSARPWRRASRRPVAPRLRGGRAVGGATFPARRPDLAVARRGDAGGRVRCRAQRAAADRRRKTPPAHLRCIGAAVAPRMAPARGRHERRLLAQRMGRHGRGCGRGGGPVAAAEPPLRAQGHRLERRRGRARSRGGALGRGGGRQRPARSRHAPAKQGTREGSGTAALRPWMDAVAGRCRRHRRGRHEPARTPGPYPQDRSRRRSTGARPPSHGGPRPRRDQRPRQRTPQRRHRHRRQPARRPPRHLWLRPADHPDPRCLRGRRRGFRACLRHLGVDLPRRRVSPDRADAGPSRLRCSRAPDAGGAHAAVDHPGGRLPRADAEPSRPAAGAAQRRLRAHLAAGAQGDAARRPGAVAPLARGRRTSLRRLEPPARAAPALRCRRAASGAIRRCRRLAGRRAAAPFCYRAGRCTGVRSRRPRGGRGPVRRAARAGGPLPRKGVHRLA